MRESLTVLLSVPELGSSVTLLQRRVEFRNSPPLGGLNLHDTRVELTESASPLPGREDPWCDSVSRRPFGG